jgi:hypothetical protein
VTPLVEVTEAALARFPAWFHGLRYFMLYTFDYAFDQTRKKMEEKNTYLLSSGAMLSWQRPEQCFLSSS